MRSLTDVVSESFIWAVGITRPKPGKERTAVVTRPAVPVVIFFTAGLLYLLRP